MLCIGLTGGIGSGKTTVTNQFIALGIDVIDADEIVHRLSTPGQDIYRDIVGHFGNKILNSDKSINRKFLADIIFEDELARKKLETTIHPTVRVNMQQAIQKVTSPYCVLVIPLLIETDFTELVDRVLVVTADKERRISWVAKRSGLSMERVESIMNTQASDKERNEIANDIITNDGSLGELLTQVKVLDSQYRKEALCE